MLARFSLLTENEINLLADNSKNSNTVKSTNTWLTVFRSWCDGRGIDCNLESYDDNKVELDAVLQRFYGEVRKQNGDDYEPDSLAVMQNGLQRYLREKNCAYSIITDPAFKKSNEVLEGKARKLRSEGKGKRPNATRPISITEEEVLWAGGHLGASTPETLLNTVWLNNTQHFGLRARQEHHDMTIENFRLSIDDDGQTEFIEFFEHPTKTRQDGLHPKKRVSTPKMFAANDDRCPVQLFKLYVSKRPVEMRNTGPFYLGIKPRSVIADPVCYMSSRMGKNKISKIFKSIIEGSSVANSGKKLTNHSARKTSIKKMKKAALPEESIIKVTGHSNPAGLRSYDEGDENEFRLLSHAIHGRRTTSTSGVETPVSMVNPASNVTASDGANVFINCNVAFNVQKNKKRKMVIYDSSQD